MYLREQSVDFFDSKNNQNIKEKEISQYYKTGKSVELRCRLKMYQKIWIFNENERIFAITIF